MSITSSTCACIINHLLILYNNPAQLRQSGPQTVAPRAVRNTQQFAHGLRGTILPESQPDDRAQLRRQAKEQICVFHVQKCQFRVLIRQLPYLYKLSLPFSAFQALQQPLWHAKAGAGRHLLPVSLSAQKTLIRVLACETQRVVKRLFPEMLFTVDKRAQQVLTEIGIKIGGKRASFTSKQV